ncbi:MAG: hypothetical protein R8J84_02095 [Mariprofundales bacterium]
MIPSPLQGQSCPPRAFSRALNPRWLLLLALACLIGGCMQSNNNELSPELLSQLQGNWQDDASPSIVRFYDDQTVKLLLHVPGEALPIQLLSTCEMMKDGVIGITLGDAWRGPARVTISQTPPHQEAASQLVLHLPGKKKGEETLFTMRKTRKL